MRCLYCGKQLALLRRLTGGGEFCSEAHKQSYHEEYNRLALGRLMHAQTRTEEQPAAHSGSAPSTPQPSPDERGSTTGKPDEKCLSAPSENAAASKQDNSSPPAPAGFFRSRSPIPEIAPGRAIPKPEEVEFSPQQPTRPRISSSSPDTSARPLPSVGFVNPGPWNARQWVAPKAPANAAPLFNSSPEMARGLGFALAPRCTLVALEFSRVTLNAIAAEAGQRALQAPLGFRFAHEFRPPAPQLAGMPTGVAVCASFASAAGEPALPEPREALDRLSRCAIAAPYPDKPPLRYLRPIELRPAPPPKATPVIPFGHIAPLNIRPALPSTTPVPLRPKIVFTEPQTIHDSAVGPRKMPRTMKIPDHIQAVQALERRKHSSAGAVLFREADIDNSGKVWETVQKYIRNLVGCVVLAALSWVVSSDLNAETRRAMHQLFIYPESLALLDYRVELTPDLSERAAELVFRAADPENYYSLQIFTWMGKTQGESAGQSSQLRIKRYAVVNGEPGIATVLALPGNYGMAPRIVLEVRGPEFRAYANGKLIESWADPRFTRGGFGFFGDGGSPQLKLVHIVGLNPAGRR